MSYLLRRALSAAAVVALGATTVFLVVAGTPGTYLDEARLTSGADPVQLDRLRARRGLNESAGIAYRSWAGALLRGSLGQSAVYDQPVAALVWPRALNTLALTTTAAGLAWTVAMPLGIWGASRQRAGDQAVGAGCLALIAVPEPLLVFAVILLARATGWLPAGGAASMDPGPRDAWSASGELAHHLIAPALATALLLIPPITMQVHNAIADQCGAPYMTGARARGVGERRLFAVHALRGAMPTILPLAGLTCGWLLSGSLVVETLFDWPGLGPLTVEAVLNRDRALVAGIVLVVATSVVTALAAGEAALWVFDPRARMDAGR